LIDNALTLAQKYKGQAIPQDVRKRNTRQISFNTGGQSGKPLGAQIKNGKRTRNILLAACEVTSLSDIVIAEATLGEGLGQQKEDDEGKEVWK